MIVPARSDDKATDLQDRSGGDPAASAFGIFEISELGMKGQVVAPK